MKPTAVFLRHVYIASFFGCLFCLYYAAFEKIFYFEHTKPLVYFTDHLWHLAVWRDGTANSKIGHLLFHVLVDTIEKTVASSQETAAILLLAMLKTASAYIKYRILRYLDGGRSSLPFLLACVLLLSLLGPLYIPFVSEYFYLGQGSPNIWHNPTLITLEPFALLAFFGGTKILAGSVRIKDTIGFLGVFSAGLFAKPSFGLVYVPASWCFWIMQFGNKDTRKERRRKLAVIILLSLLFVIISYYQAKILFNKSGITIDPLGVWSLYSSNIPFSILAGLLFCLSLARFRFQQLKQNPYLVIGWIATGIAILVFALLAETGRRYSHANFGWSYNLCQTILFLFSLQEYIRWKQEQPNPVEFRIVTVILILHLVSGIGCLIRILTGWGFW